jgi:hypothetical protein
MHADKTLLNKDLRQPDDYWISSTDFADFRRFKELFSRKDAEIVKGKTQIRFGFSWRSWRLGERNSWFRPKSLP